MNIESQFVCKFTTSWRPRRDAFLFVAMYDPDRVVLRAKDQRGKHLDIEISIRAAEDLAILLIAFSQYHYTRERTRSAREKAEAIVKHDNRDRSQDKGDNRQTG